MAGALSAALGALPAALRSHARLLERFAAGTLMLAHSPPRLRLAASQLLALVPRSAGDLPAALYLVHSQCSRPLCHWQ